MISIVGKGNVATHLYEAFKNKVDVVMVNPHTLEDLPTHSDIIIVCVSDNAIEEVASRLPQSNAIVVHTSGSMPMDILQSHTKFYGVMYPLQTFTKGVFLNYEEIPVFIEGMNDNVMKKLKTIAALFSKDIREADSVSRLKLHIASVFACNFINALARISKDLMDESGIDFSALKPLMKQTINKLDVLSPKEAQTGPAVRGDSMVINQHLEMLSSRPEIQNLYQQLTDIIQDGKI